MEHDGLRYDSDKIDQVADVVRSILDEKGRVTNYDLMKKADFSDIGLSQNVIELRILPYLRERFAEEGILKVDTEEMHDGFERKVWVLQ